MGPLNGRKVFENKIGIFSRTAEQHSKDSIKAGIKNAQNKTGVCGQSKEKMSENGRKGGLISGRKSVESGHIQALGTAQGRKNIKSGHIQALGKIQGRKNAESGFMAEVGRIHGVINGRIAGRKAVDSGLLESIRPLGSHTRWHVNRKILNPNCKFCVAAKQEDN